MRSFPEQYLSLRAALGFDELSLGYGGLQLFTLDKLESAQVGYSVRTDGTPLMGNKPDDWQANWLVIGIETCCGDPIFISDESPTRCLPRCMARAPGNRS